MHTIEKTLTACAKNNTLSHTTLILGPDGIGKTRVAIKLAVELLSCEQDVLTSHPEFIQIQPEGNTITIEQIRTLSAQLKNTTLNQSNRVVIIEHIEQATISAANALLKSIEEPRPNTFIILTASHTQTVPQTILSRCAVVPLSHIADHQLQDTVKDFESQLAKKMLTWAAGRPELLKDIITNEEIRGQWHDAASELFHLLTTAHDQRLAWVEAIPKNAPREQIITKIDQFTVMLRSLIFSHAQTHPNLLKQLQIAIDVGCETKTRLAKNIQQRGLLDTFVLSLPKLNG